MTNLGEKIYRWVERNAQPAYILFGLLWIICVNTFLFPNFPTWIDPSFNLSGILDVKFGIHPETALNYFKSLGEKGREAYFYTSAILDNIYALTYCFIYAILLFFLIKKVYQKNYYSKLKLIKLPFLVSASDIMENISIQLSLLYFPNANNILLYFASVFNMLKWVLAAVLIFSILFLVLKWILVLIKK
jgi:hypothetical protein